MWPDLIPGIDFWMPKTFGVIIMIGTCISIWLAAKRGEGFGFKKDRVWDFGIYMVLAGILGARFIDVWEKWGTGFWPNYTDGSWSLWTLIWKCFAIWEGGLTFYGGFIFAGILGIYLLRKWDYPLGKFTDVIVPSMALGHAFGRVACFLQGCCYGSTCEHSWGVVFPDDAMVYGSSDYYNAPPVGTAVHPTQLYESGAELFLFFFLSWLLFRRHTTGSLMFVWMLLYGAARFTVEFWRVDNQKHEWMGLDLHFSQYVSLVMMFVGVVGIWALRISSSEDKKNQEIAASSSE